MDSIFESVTQDEHNVYFTLADGQVITISKSGAKKLSITFDCGNNLELNSGVGKYIYYTIEGGTENNVVKAELYKSIESLYYPEVTVTQSTTNTGKIFISLGTLSDKYQGTNKILVTVSNGETTIMTTINITAK